MTRWYTGKTQGEALKELAGKAVPDLPVDTDKFLVQNHLMSKQPFGEPPQNIDNILTNEKTILAALDEAKRRVPEAWNKSRTAAMSNWQDTAKKISQELIRQHNESNALARADAQARANHALLDYSRKRGFDPYIDLVSPYAHWGTRQGRNFLFRTMTDPAIFNHWVRYTEFADKYNKERGTRQRYEGKYSLDELTGGLLSSKTNAGTVYINPLARSPFEAVFHTDYDDPIQQRTTLQTIYDTMGLLGIRPSPVLDVPLRLSSALIDKGASKEEQEKQAASYGPESMQRLYPFGAALQGVTSLLGMRGGLGLDVEGAINTYLGVKPRFQETYDIGRSIDTLAYEMQNKPDFDAQPYVLAQVIHDRAKDSRDTIQRYVLGDPMEISKELAEKLGVTRQQAGQALEVYRAGVMRAGNERGLQRAIGWLTGFAAVVGREGEMIRMGVQADEREAGYNKDTGYGSLAGRKAVQEANPATEVSRAQYATYPGDKKDPLDTWKWMERDNITEAFDALKDRYILAKPWDKQGARDIENKKWEALKALDKTTPAQALPDWSLTAAKLSDTIKGGAKMTTTTTAANATYAPKSIAASNPKEAVEVRKAEILKAYNDTKPDTASFLDDDGNINFTAYYKALDDWTANSVTRIKANPITKAVLEQAEKDGDDIAKNLNKWLTDIKVQDLKEYKARYDSPVEAAQAIWFDKVYNKAFEEYRDAKGDKNAYANTVGKYGPMDSAAIIALIKKEYPNKWSDAELTKALDGFKMPSVQEVSKARVNPDVAAKQAAVDSFMTTLNAYVPPGKMRDELMKDNPLLAGVISAKYDSKLLTKLTPEMAAQAEIMIRGWASANHVKANPEEWAAANKIKDDRDTFMAAKYGDNWTKYRDIWFSTDSKQRAQLVQYPGIAAMMADYNGYTKGNALYEKYFGSKAETLKSGSTTTGGGGSGSSGGKGRSSSNSFFNAYYDLTPDQRKAFVASNPEAKKYLDPSTRGSVAAADVAKLVKGMGNTSAIQKQVEATQDFNSARSSFWDSYYKMDTKTRGAITRSNPDVAKIMTEATQAKATTADYQKATLALMGKAPATQSGGGNSQPRTTSAPRAATTYAPRTTTQYAPRQATQSPPKASVPTYSQRIAQEVLSGKPMTGTSQTQGDDIKSQVWSAYFAVPMAERSAMLNSNPSLKKIINKDTRAGATNADYMTALTTMQGWKPEQKTYAPRTGGEKATPNTTPAAGTKRPDLWSFYRSQEKKAMSGAKSSGRSGGGGGGRRSFSSAYQRDPRKFGQGRYGKKPFRR